jgi:CHASE3 domain sensor protein
MESDKIHKSDDHGQSPTESAGVKMKSSLERKVTAAIALALISISGFGVLQYRMIIRRVNEDSRRLSHTQAVLLELQGIRNGLNRADTSALSFVITGDAVT